MEQTFPISKKVKTTRCSRDLQSSLEGQEEKDDVLNKVDEVANEFTSKDGDIRMQPEDDPFYHRFSPARKHFLVFLVGLSCFLSPSSNIAFLPAVPIIASRFETTSTVINISNTAYTLLMALSPCVMSQLSDIYGRRSAFLACSLGFTICTVLVAVSQDLAMFFVFRCFTASFGTAFSSVGGEVS